MMNKVAIDCLVDQANGLVDRIPGLFRQPGEMDKVREHALACYKCMMELGDQNRAAAIPLALAGAELFLALTNFASPQPDWVAIHEELCCRYGAIWIVELISEGYPGAELWRDQPFYKGFPPLCSLLNKRLILSIMLLLLPAMRLLMLVECQIPWVGCPIILPRASDFLSKCQDL
jgi:hypothetical protein